MNNLLICLFLISGVLAQDCSTKVSSLELVLATDEQQWWGLQDVFFGGVNLSYKLSDTTHFDLIDPLKTVADPKAYIQKANVVKGVPFTQIQNGAWLNSFALLDSTAGYNVFWAQGSSIGGLTSPSFQTVTPVLGEQSTQKCFGLDYVSSSKIIVDCFDSQTGINYFQVVTADGAKQVQVTDSLKISTVTDRQVKVLRVQSLLEEVVYIFRTYNDGNSVAPQSLIEVYTIDSTDNIVLFSILDTATLAIAMNDLTGKFMFDLIQMEVQENGMVYILDKNNVYRFSLTADGQWHLKGYINLNAQKTYSMSINNQFDATGDYITNLVVLHLDTFVLYEWPLTSTTAKMTRVYETNTFVQTYPGPLLQVSQGFIFFQDPKTNNMRMYGTTSQSIILETGPVSSQWLINPYEGRIVSLDSQNAQAWAFSRGQLNYKSNMVVTNNLPLTITATSTVGGVYKECTSTLIYSVYDKNDFTLVKLADQSNPLVLPEEFLSEDTNIALRALVSGPNQQFQQLLPVVPKGFLRDDPVTNPSVYLKSLQLQNLTLRAVESKFDNAQSVIFVETMAFDDPNKFIEIIQNADLSVKIWTCVMVKELSSLSTCEVYGSFKTTEKLSSNSLQTWFFFDQLLIGALTTKYNISVFVCDEGECNSIRNISYEAVVGQEINSFVILNQNMWVVRANLKIIEIYNTFAPYTLMLTANAELALQNGYMGVWAPQQVFGNRNLNPSTIFIDNGAELIVADYHTQLTLIKALSYKLESPQVAVAVASTTFFIAERNETMSVLREFNYADLADIKLQKDVYLYWYQFQTPLQADFSAQNGYFFIRALCTKCDLTFVLVFKPNTSQRDVLFQAINTGLKVDNGKSIIFSPSGNDNMYLYLNTGVSQSTFSLLNNAVVRVIPGNNAELVTQNSALDMVIKNFDMEGFNTVEYHSLVNVFNTNTDVSFDNAAFQKKSKSGLKIHRGKSQNIPLYNDWFSGQVLYYKLQCRNCTSGNVHVKQRVNAEKLPFSLAEVTDFSPLPKSETFLAQAPSTLWFLKNMKQATPFLDMDLPEGVTCKLVSSVDSGLYVLSICMSTSQNYLHITSCIAQGQCFSAGLLELTGAAQIVKFAVAESTQAISIVVLSNNADQGSVIVYKLTTNGQLWALEKTQDMVGDYNAVDMILVQFLDMDDQYYKLILTDKNSGLFHMTGSNKVGGVLTLESRGPINLRTTLTGLKQFISESTQFLGISLFNTTISGTQLILSTVVTTSNVAHFGLNLMFEIANPDSSPFTDLSVLFNLNRYGKNKALNKLRVQNGTIIIAYESQVASDMIALCKYKIPIAASPLKFALSTTLVNFDGGAEITTDGEDLAYIPLSIQTNATTGQNTLYTNQDSAYNFYDSAEIVVDDSTGVSNQDLTIIAYNEQVGDSVQTTTQIDLENLDEDGWQWWYTLLIVIGAIALLSVVFACIRKNKGKDSVRESLLQVQQDTKH